MASSDVFAAAGSSAVQVRGRCVHVLIARSWEIMRSTRSFRATGTRCADEGLGRSVNIIGELSWNAMIWRIPDPVGFNSSSAEGEDDAWRSS